MTHLIDCVSSCSFHTSRPLSDGAIFQRSRACFRYRGILSIPAYTLGCVNVQEVAKLV